ncbi:hypothetical protein [Streptomyces sp. NPDC054765]
MSATRRQILVRTGVLGAGIAFSGSLTELFTSSPRPGRLTPGGS